jgi:hypothetical protein
MAPDSEQMDPASFRAAWDDATRVVEAAYGEIRPLARKLSRAMRWEQYVQYDFFESKPAIADSQASYLVTRTITAPDADYPNLKRWDVVTPGYMWHLRRHLDREERDELAVSVQISLTADGDGVARLRSGDRLTPATPEAWSELTAGVLEPRAVRIGRLGRSPLKLLWMLTAAFLSPVLMFWPILLVGLIGMLILKACG